MSQQRQQSQQYQQQLGGQQLQQLQQRQQRQQRQQGQQGGKISDEMMAAMIPGSDRVLANGATGAFFNTTTKDGQPTKVFRIYKSTRAAVQRAIDARRKPRKITQEQAQQAFDKFYARTRTIKRGPRKGQPIFASPRGRKNARTYDLTHRGKKVVNDARYLNRPDRYEFQGVDTGTKPAKKATPKQLAALAAGRAKRKANLQRGGYWW